MRYYISRYKYNQGGGGGHFSTPFHCVYRFPVNKIEGMSGWMLEWALLLWKHGLSRYFHYLVYCAVFGVEYVITFNEKKSVCLHFNSDDSDNPDILLNDKCLICKSSAKHLGNIVSHNLQDENYILMKKNDFYNQINVMMADYQRVDCQVLSELFKKCSISFYGCQA